MIPLDYLISALVTLLVVVDPIGLAPVFLAVTHGLPSKARLQIAWRACAIAIAILIGTALIGDWLLHQLGITGNAVLSRLLGVILAALAVQYVIDGLRTAFTS